MLSREAVVHKMFRASSLWFCPHILFNSASPYLRPLWYLSARPWRHWQTLITPASLPGPSTHAPSVQQPWPELKKSSWSMLPVNPCSALSWFSEWYFCRDACPALQKAFSLALCRVLSLLFLLGFPGGTLDLTDHLTRSLESRKNIEPKRYRNLPVHQNVWSLCIQNNMTNLKSFPLSSSRKCLLSNNGYLLWTILSCCSWGTVCITKTSPHSSHYTQPQQRGQNVAGACPTFPVIYPVEDKGFQSRHLSGWHLSAAINSTKRKKGALQAINLISGYT